jgi:ABC-type nitrate/sulfonate/bicarbonate transport system substrate-binding protein
MRHRWAGALAAISGIVLLTAGCGGASSSTSSTSTSTGSTPAAAAGSKNIKLIEGGGLDFSDATIYEAMSLLKAQGYNVTLDNVADSTTAMRAVLAGKDDVYLGDPVEAATAVANSHAALKYLATVAQASDYELLSLPKITMSSLSGATMATAGPGTAGQIIGIAALAKAGINTGEIHQVTVGGTSARVTAILAGQVDIAPVLATDAASAVATGKVKILLNAGAALGTYLQQGLIASDSFAADSATAQATVNAFINASRWAYTNESAYVQLATANQLTPGLTASESDASWSALKTANFWASNGALCTQSINVTLNYSYQTPGGLTKANTPSLSSWVDPTYVNAYLKAHGQPAGAC